MTDQASVTVRQSPAGHMLELLQRAVALLCLIQGIAYWVRLLGFFEGAEWRFDLMPFYWQATAAPLGVLFPFAAVGLWMLASWGPVIWFLCAVAEIVMYGVFTDLFGYRPGLIMLHGAVAASYVGLRIAAHLARQQATN